MKIELVDETTGLPIDKMFVCGSGGIISYADYLKTYGVQKVKIIADDETELLQSYDEIRKGIDLAIRLNKLTKMRR